MNTGKDISVLETQGLAIGYTSKKEITTVVRDIDIRVLSGQLIGLVGINGSGKSTFLRTLSGLQKPLQGEISLNNALIATLNPLQLAQQLSIVLTGQHISQQLTVYELVALGRQPYTGWTGNLQKEDHDQVILALEATSLLELQDRRCGTLSDGQLQRAIIARALAQNTAIILMDEPLAHLDLHHKAALLLLLEKIAHQQQKTIIFSTHEISHALPLCDAFMVIQEGKLHFDQTQKLIEEGIFDTLFPSTHIVFDSTTKQYRIRT